MTQTDFTYSFVYAIVDFGVGSKVLHKAKEFGVTGGTIFSARGTVDNFILKMLCLTDERKEVVLMGTDSQTASDLLVKLDQCFHFERPHCGIAFEIPLIGTVQDQKTKGLENMYQNILTIVDRGLAEDVIEAAKLAGARGGTIINARGSGIHETQKIFQMEVEPEKEMVMVIASEAKTPAIVQSIRENLELDKPGKGILFVQNIAQVYGIQE